MRSVLVTGVSTGIGKAIAEELLKNDFFVIGSVRKKKDAEYFEENYSNNFKSVILDITKKKDIQNAKQEVEKILLENKSYFI